MPNEQLHFIGLEAAQVRGDEEVAAARHGDAPRLGADRVRLRDMFAVPWHEHEPHAVAEGCRPEQRDEQRDADDAGENAGAHVKLALVDVPPIVDAVHALERRARQMREQRARNGSSRSNGVAGVSLGLALLQLDSREHGRVERGRVLFQVERDSPVARLSPGEQWHTDENRGEHGDDEEDNSPRDDERRVAVMELVEDVRRSGEQHEGGGEHDARAAQCPLQPPAIPHAMHDAR